MIKCLHGMLVYDSLLYVMRKTASLLIAFLFIVIQAGWFCPCAHATENPASVRYQTQNKSACHQGASSENSNEACCGAPCSLHAVSDRGLPQFNLAFSDIVSFRPSPASPDFSLLTLAQAEENSTPRARERFHRASSSIASLAQPLFISLETLRI